MKTELERIDERMNQIMTDLGPEPNVVEFVDAEYAYASLAAQRRRLFARRRKIERRKERVRRALDALDPMWRRPPKDWYTACVIRRAILTDQHYYPEAWT